MATSELDGLVSRREATNKDINVTKSLVDQLSSSLKTTSDKLDEEKEKAKTPEFILQWVRDTNGNYDLDNLSLDDIIQNFKDELNEATLIRMFRDCIKDPYFKPTVVYNSYCAFLCDHANVREYISWFVMEMGIEVLLPNIGERCLYRSPEREPYPYSANYKLI